MSRNNTPWQALASAEITWTDDGSPCSPAYDDFYYSTVDGVEEANYVFLKGSQIAQRLLSHPHATFCVAETGFGTGLNFLLTWKLWREQPLPRPHLHFVSIESQPVRSSDIRKALQAWPALSELTETLIDNYPEPIPGQHRLILDDGAVTLDLWWEDAVFAIPDLCGRLQKSVDVWYLDGFSPNRNPSIWTPSLYQNMATASRTGASFATFTAAGDVRRGLEKAGFQVTKSPGWGLKRECMHGELGAAAIQPAQDLKITPWDIDCKQLHRPKTALVVGAGLAGCTVASALAKRGVAVTVIEAGRIAGGGSGNDQGVLYTRLSKKHSPLVDFSLQSFSFAYRFYKQMLGCGQLTDDIDGSLCGSFHQNSNTEALAAMAQQLLPVPQLAQVLRADAANQILGIEQQHGGYWYPQSGWMRPSSICHALLQHPNITVVENSGPVDLVKENTDWHAITPVGAIAQSPCAVVATGPAAASMPALDWLPVSAIRGQTTNLSRSEQTGSLRTVLCHTGYISPDRLGNHCIGATFDIADDDANSRSKDHRYNLDSLAKAVPAWGELLAEIKEDDAEGRVAYRCASPDYLPLIGAVPNHSAFLETYSMLRKNARRVIPYNGEYLAGLYLTTGHGSRGLTSTPLAAEILASTICKEPPPLSRELSRALAPARFIIRDLRRKRT
ncbi:MAG: tRNA 5-methylaminomethyl-2-thiouridine biosynthesis bifunctional protein [Halioglobus sp.]|jgi:tRNA 5-methylaminomethyl-2-thiouridine biosynthesis bifunctional protein